MDNASTLHTRYDRYRKVIDELTIMDDIFMRSVLKNLECTEYILQVIFNNKNLKVVEVIIQKDYKNLQGRSALLDCVAADEKGRQFDVEIQGENKGASPKRARYHSGLLDMNTLNPGEDFDKLPETYVIFITEKDVLGLELPIYHIRRRIDETDKEFGDQSHILYVNSSVQEDTELGRLMHDLHCKRADEMYSPILAKQVRYLKETQKKEETSMEHSKLYWEFVEECKAEGKLEGRLEGILEGEARGRAETGAKIALNLSKHGMEIADIAQIIDADIDNVQKWLAESVATAK